MLDDRGAIGGVCDLQPEDLGLFFGLLKAVAGFLVRGLSFYNGDWEVTAVAKQGVGTLLRATTVLTARHHNAPRGGSLLFADFFLLPTRAGEPGGGVLSARVCFSPGGHSSSGFSL